MFTKLALENFKSFKEANLSLGPCTVLIGANATGKSNLTEAFRILQRIGQGRNLPKIFGDQSLEENGRQRSIRGGSREIAFHQANNFAINVTLDVETAVKQKESVEYHIRIAPQTTNPWPVILEEWLKRTATGQTIFSTNYTPDPQHKKSLRVALYEDAASSDRHHHTTPFPDVLAQPELGNSDLQWQLKEDSNQIVKAVLHKLRQIHIYDLQPIDMRQPAIPGETDLSERGGNLSSVLHTLCQNKEKKARLLSWLSELAPTEITDFEFIFDASGQVLTILVEKTGQKVTIHSASDGTLRLLGLLTTLFSATTEPYFHIFEEIENGIHPSRLHLITDLIDSVTTSGQSQVLFSTHSPYVLNFLDSSVLHNTFLLYRLDQQPDTHIQSIMNLPDAAGLLETQGLMRLYESGWFENIVYFMDDNNSAQMEMNL